MELVCRIFQVFLEKSLIWPWLSSLSLRGLRNWRFFPPISGRGQQQEEDEHGDNNGNNEAKAFEVEAGYLKPVILLLLSMVFLAGIKIVSPTREFLNRLKKKRREIKNYNDTHSRLPFDLISNL